MMAAFAGSATAVLFHSPDSIDQQGAIDTAGTSIEKDIRERIEENPLSTFSSRLSFINSDFEEVKMSPKDPPGVRSASKQLGAARCCHIAHTKDC